MKTLNDAHVAMAALNRLCPSVANSSRIAKILI